MTASESILTSVKAPLGLAEDDTAFDADLIFQINSVLSDLNALGVGPEDGLTISDKTTRWSDLIGENKKLQSAKQYLFLRVKILFDPPATAPLLASYEKMIEKHEWHLVVRTDDRIPVILKVPADPQDQLPLD